MAKDKPKRRTRQYTLRIDEDLFEAIDRKAACERRTLASMINVALFDRFGTPHDQSARASA